MSANTLESWANFFITAASVSATLAGLVIVAVSVNIQQILRYAQLPPRASGTVTNLMLVVAIGLVGLMPQRATAFAIEVLAFSAFAWAILLACTREICVEHLKSGRAMVELVVGLAGWHLAALAFGVGAVLSWSGLGNGLYWMAGGVIVTVMSAVLNAWVFLIEVLR
jgi:hypothetical protein